MTKTIDKYLFQCKEFCLKCDIALSFYKPGEKGKVIPVICEKCKSKIQDKVKKLSKPYYWTAKGIIEAK